MITSLDIDETLIGKYLCRKNNIAPFDYLVIKVVDVNLTRFIGYIHFSSFHAGVNYSKYYFLRNNNDYRYSIINEEDLIDL